MEATHYIETYRHFDGFVINTNPASICKLSEYIYNTIHSGGYTIAIFKIKYK